MRAYSESSEEALRARDLLKEWAAEGFFSEAQYRVMEQETVCELRRTNIFLRLVLFVFTLIVVGAGVALFFAMFLSQPGLQTTGVFLLIFAAGSYAAAEYAVSRARLYRYGIEEAVAAGSVAFLCFGMQAVLSSRAESLSLAAGAIASLWIWRRFGLLYAFPAAMIFAALLPGYWTSSRAAQHLFVAAIYASGLIAVARQPIVEALLWLGIYLAINLRAEWWTFGRTAAEFAPTFYWTTWVLTWFLPPVILARGLRRKDRFVIAVGAIAVILTLVTNKPYLGWQRHTWDPMLLGALLIGVALFLRRWLARGPGEIRHGFTAQRLSGRDKHWMNAGAAAFGLLSPHPIAPGPQTGSPDVHFGGGDSGGGGASSDY